MRRRNEVGGRRIPAPSAGGISVSAIGVVLVGAIVSFVVVGIIVGIGVIIVAI
jgi:hypothetical protein